MRTPTHVAGSPPPAEPGADAAKVLTVSMRQALGIDAASIGKRGLRLACAAHAGLAVPAGTILSTTLTAQLAVDGIPDADYHVPDHRNPRRGASPALNALTRAWHEVARGGLVAVTVVACGDEPAVAMDSEPVHHWADFLHRIDEIVRAQQDASPLTVQRHVNFVQRGTATNVLDRLRHRTAVHVDGGTQALLVTPTGRAPRRSTQTSKLDARQLRSIATLARRVDHTMGAPHTITWGFDAVSASAWLVNLQPIDRTAHEKRQ